MPIIFSANGSGSGGADWSATSEQPGYIKNKPTSMTPSTHSHTVSELSDLTKIPYKRDICILISNIDTETFNVTSLIATGASPTSVTSFEPSVIYTFKSSATITNSTITILGKTLKYAWAMGTNVTSLVNSHIYSFYYNTANDCCFLTDTSESCDAFSYGTTDLTAGVSTLQNGKLYFVYE